METTELPKLCKMATMVTMATTYRDMISGGHAREWGAKWDWDG